MTIAEETYSDVATGEAGSGAPNPASPPRNSRRWRGYPASGEALPKECRPPFKAFYCNIAELFSIGAATMGLAAAGDGNTA